MSIIVIVTWRRQLSGCRQCIQVLNFPRDQPQPDLIHCINNELIFHNLWYDMTDHMWFIQWGWSGEVHLAEVQRWQGQYWRWQLQIQNKRQLIMTWHNDNDKYKRQWRWKWQRPLLQHTHTVEHFPLFRSWREEMSFLRFGFFLGGGWWLGFDHYSHYLMTTHSKFSWKIFLTLSYPGATFWKIKISKSKWSHVIEVLKMFTPAPGPWHLWSQTGPSWNPNNSEKIESSHKSWQWLPGVKCNANRHTGLPLSNLDLKDKSDSCIIT